MRLILALAFALFAAAGPVVAKTQKPPPPWQKVILEPDRKRLAGLWNAWTRGLAEADKAGMRPQLAGLGDLVVPDAAKPASAPPPGAYRCRTITLGIREGSTAAASASVPAMTMGNEGACTISRKGGLLWFEQSDGPRRVGGKLFDDDERMVFLGSQALAGEMGLMAYGADGQRDQVGVLRAVGERRWRLELPWPMWQSNMVVIEIVPA